MSDKVIYSESGTQSCGLHYWRREYVREKDKLKMTEEREITPQEFADHLLSTGHPHHARWAKRVLADKQYTAAMR